ncbi:hypothetical protein LX36DRAFT_728593 [Colletotrichum falcatum]|nr:hypothetical protein LX36DRAFT_728593 [Colletotrichum falcatum]
MKYSNPNSSKLWKSFELQRPVYSARDADAQISKFPAHPHRQYYSQVLEEVPEEVHGRSPPTPKRIIICCDGTWQSSVNGRHDIPSNVTRLARSIAPIGKIKVKKESRTTDHMLDDHVKHEELEEVSCQQIVYYSSGIGTSGGVGLVGNLWQALFGDGLVTDVIEAYNFVVMNYLPGDEICCFGFSRGAYTARAVAGLITDLGIIQPRDMDGFPDLYKLYQRHRVENGPFRQSKEYREWITGKFEGDRHVQRSHRLPPELSRVIQVVGVFDTVGALGVPGMHWAQKLFNFIGDYALLTGIDYKGFHNTSLSNYTKHAFHALALDEHIKPFTPTLWYLPNLEEDAYKQFVDKYGPLDNDKVDNRFRNLLNRGYEKRATEEELSAAWKKVIKAQVAAEPRHFKPELRQVWFPGSHVNIGGGNSTLLVDFSYDFEQMALITFAWMCDQITPFVQLDDGKVKETPDHFSSLAAREIASRNDLIRRSKEKSSGIFGFLQRLWRLLAYFIYAPPEDDQGYDWATGPIIDIFDILGGFLILGVTVFLLKLIPFTSSYRTPGQYKDPSQKGVTNEMIHPSAHYRLASRLDYNPKSLKGFIRSKITEDPRKPKTLKYFSTSEDKGPRPMYEWKRKEGEKEVKIWEYVIKKEDRISRHLIEYSKAKEFMAPLMERKESTE